MAWSAIYQADEYQHWVTARARPLLQLALARPSRDIAGGLLARATFASRGTQLQAQLGKRLDWRKLLSLHGAGFRRLVDASSLLEQPRAQRRTGRVGDALRCSVPIPYRQADEHQTNRTSYASSNRTEKLRDAWPG